MKKRTRRRHSKRTAGYALKIAGKIRRFRLKRAARKAAMAAHRAGRKVHAVPGCATGLAAGRRSKKRGSKRRHSKKRHSVRKNRRRSHRRHSVRRNRRRSRRSRR